MSLEEGSAWTTTDIQREEIKRETEAVARKLVEARKELEKTIAETPEPPPSVDLWNPFSTKADLRPSKKKEKKKKKKPGRRGSTAGRGPSPTTRAGSCPAPGS